MITKNATNSNTATATTITTDNNHKNNTAVMFLIEWFQPEVMSEYGNSGRSHPGRTPPYNPPHHVYTDPTHRATHPPDTRSSQYSNYQGSGFINVCRIHGIAHVNMIIVAFI